MPGSGPRSQCGWCEKWYSHAGNMRAHQKKNCPRRPNAPGPKVVSDDPSRVKCEACGNTFTNKSNCERHQTSNCPFRPDAEVAPERVDPQVALDECRQHARDILPDPPENLFVARREGEGVINYRFRAVQGLHHALVAIFKPLGLPEFVDILHVGIYGPSPAKSHPFLVELRQLRDAFLVQLNIGPSSRKAFDAYSVYWCQTVQDAREKGTLEPSPALSETATDFLAGVAGSARNRQLSDIANPFSDPKSGASRIVGPLMNFYGIPFSEMCGVLKNSFTLLGDGHAAGVARLLCGVASYIMKIKCGHALAHVRKVFCAQSDDPEAPLLRGEVSVASQNFLPGKPHAKLAMRLLFEAADEHHIARPLAHAAYTLGADRNKYPFIRPLRKTWFGKYVGAVDVPWTHPSGANGFALLMGTAWDSMRAVGAHVGGEWTLEDFATIERLQETHSYGYIARQLGRTYSSIKRVAVQVRRGEVRITANGMLDLAKTETVESSSSSGSSSSAPRKRKTITSSSSAASSFTSSASSSSSATPGRLSSSVSRPPTKKLKTTGTAKHVLDLSDD